MTGFLHHQQPSPAALEHRHEVFDLLRYEGLQCLFFGNHPLVMQGSDLQEGLGLSEEDTNAQRIALTPSETHDPDIF